MCNVAALALAALLWQAAGPAADAWLARSARPLDFQQATGQGYALDVPRKDWLLVPGTGPILVAIVHKTGRASIFVERARLNQPLGPDDVGEFFAQLEADLARERHAGASAFQQKVLASGDRRLVGIQFDFPRAGGADRVRQYSMPMGTQMLRVICAAPAAEFAKFEPVFTHVAASFQAAGPRTTP